MSDQESLELAILIDRREQFEAAYEYWRGQSGAVDGDSDAIVAMLLMRDQWHRLTAALDRRFARLLHFEGPVLTVGHDRAGSAQVTGPTRDEELQRDSRVIAHGSRCAFCMPWPGSQQPLGAVMA